MLYTAAKAISYAIRLKRGFKPTFKVLFLFTNVGKVKLTHNRFLLSHFLSVEFRISAHIFQFSTFPFNYLPQFFFFVHSIFKYKWETKEENSDCGPEHMNTLNYSKDTLN